MAAASGSALVSRGRDRAPRLPLRVKWAFTLARVASPDGSIICCRCMSPNADTRPNPKTPEEIVRILDLHGRWLRKQPGGMRADLTLQDLPGVNLPGIVLRGA